jgi:hypothetical protein
MANNLIQIKRSATAAVPASLANGELAFTSNGNVLYIGSPNGSIVGIGGARFPGTLTANQALVANSTSGINEIRTALANVGAIYANGSLGTAGQVLTSNSTGIYWSVAATGDGTVTSVGSGSGLTGGPITNSGTISVLANNGIVANSTGVFVNPGTGVTVNTSGVHIGQAVETTSNVTFNRITATGNVALGDAIADLVSINGSVNTNIMPSANVTYSLGNTSIRWLGIFAANVHSNTGYFDGSVQIGGNLSVLGTTFTTSANNLIVDDSLIQLAANNTTSDLLDIGFYGSYDAGVAPHEHTGLFRDASDGGLYKLFSGLQDSPTNLVNTAGVGYTTATLQAYLNSGAFISNTTTVAITANASVNVAIIANTLTLSTALAGTSGGTGRGTTTNNALLVGNSTNGYNELTLSVGGYVLQSNGTALVYDTLDGGSF